MDARRDLVFALLGRPLTAPRFFGRAAARSTAPARALEAFDLGGVARDHALDALAAALAVPVATEPHLVTFAAEGPWRGETHRLCDRPGALGRLLEEVATAGAEQVILVAPSAPPARAHELSAGRADLRGRAGEQLAGLRGRRRCATRSSSSPAASPACSSSVRRTTRSARSISAASTTSAPTARTPLAELVDRGYEDAYRQFIEPVVGAGGERIATVQRANGPRACSVELQQSDMLSQTAES